MICDLIIRNAVMPVGGICDVAVANGRIANIGSKLDAKGPELDAAGNLLLPGLIDHHIHLLATAARLESADLSGLVSEDEVIRRLREAEQVLAAGAMLRATGYDERAFDLPDSRDLDRWLPDRPLRMQDRTGALWLLNGLAMERLGTGPWPDCVEVDERGEPTGRIWRGDAWLRERLGAELPPVAKLGSELARLGITGVTDTGAANGPSEAALFNELLASGELPQKLQLMGDETLPVSDHFRRGPLKLLYDERDLPPLEEVARRIDIAREQGRAVAAHCITESELVYFIAALDLAGGARPGDRIEHGSEISGAMIPEIVAHGLAIVTHPAFVHDRGDRYLDTVAREELGGLYRLASLETAGLCLAAGSDAPYGSFDPWLALEAAKYRKTAQGRVLGVSEAMAVERTLPLYLRPFGLSDCTSRTIEPGAEADFCVIEGSLQDLADCPDAGRVAATIVDGKVIYTRL